MKSLVWRSSYRGVTVLFTLAWILGTLPAARALERTNVTFKIFQFPPDRIPRVDGDSADWEMVPADYVIGTDQLKDTVGGRDKNDPRDLDVTVRVGWVKGMSQLWFLYEAYDDYWDFSRSDLRNDIFELVVDGDMSGGPLIKDMHSVWKHRPDGYFRFQGNHAQNYHIFTPAEGKDWTMVWGGQSWIKERPFANAAYKYDFRPGQSGRLVLEFWITPFDHAPSEGPTHARISQLRENEFIGMSWAVLDYDDVKSEQYKGFWNLSHKTTMYGDASDLCRFQLMAMDARFRPKLAADWTFEILSLADRQVAFRDQTMGEVDQWNWDFGDGQKSTQRHPTHQYAKGGHYVVVLEVKGRGGESKRSKVWDLTLP